MDEYNSDIDYRKLLVKYLRYTYLRHPLFILRYKIWNVDADEYATDIAPHVGSDEECVWYGGGKPIPIPTCLKDVNERYFHSLKLLMQGGYRFQLPLKNKYGHTEDVHIWSLPFCSISELNIITALNGL